MGYNYESVSASYLKEVAEADRVVELKLPLSDGSNVQKVLSVVADGRTVNVIANEGEIDFSGRVTFKLTFISDSDELSSLDYFADFEEKLNADVKQGAMVSGRAEVIETDVSTSGELTLSAVVKIKVFASVKKEIDCLVETPEQCYAEKAEVAVKTLADCIGKEFVVTGDDSIGGDVKKILSTDCVVAITELKAGENVAYLGGTVTARVTYAFADTVKCSVFEMPFAEDLEINVDSVGSLSCDVEVKNVRIIISGTEGDNVIEFEALVAAKVCSYVEKKTSVVGDVFMLDREIAVARSEFEYSQFDKTLLFDDKLTDSAKLSESRSAVREILSPVNASNNVAKVWAENGKVFIEGLVCSTVIYSDENGFNSVKVEIPYSTSFNADLTGSENLTASGVVAEIAPKIKRDREIEIAAKLNFKVEASTSRTLKVISEVTEGEIKPVNESTISVYIASEGDTIWDVAKAFSASPDKILSQNELPQVLTEGQRVIYFRCL